MIRPSDLTRQELERLVEGILEIMYPGGDMENEWSSDELPRISELLDDYLDVVKQDPVVPET